jgi:thiamine pyrophosphokinase
MRNYANNTRNTNNSICHIFGAGDFDLQEIKINEKDLVIAADGGYRYLKTLNIKPDILIGDFDSLDILPEGIDTKHFPIEKDDTDVFLAAKEGISRGYKVFAIYGALGGTRISHSLANISLLAWLNNKDAQGFLIESKTEITSIKNGCLAYASGENGNLSVFAYGKNAEGVCITGLKYETENVTLATDFPLGVSNSFVGKEARISVENGTLIVIKEDAV